LYIECSSAEDFTIKYRRFSFTEVEKARKEFRRNFFTEFDESSSKNSTKLLHRGRHCLSFLRVVSKNRSIYSQGYFFKRKLSPIGLCSIFCINIDISDFFESLFCHFAANVCVRFLNIPWLVVVL
jgi:hypothetical protein